ncbi:aspartate kinase [Ancylomarina salipaludis]|uniref:Aspartokinase n=1 Tax=Ancylomarina salipaludis TaxID=2501299 RepID=A0A4Q1JQ66_9BACT|nr:aspartate kinase [Ancylomarina salipaludis]RXQ96547.1 aspartate kinase [Ancylomarina salipaludis]
MIIYKFGGVSVKDASAIRNVSKIIGEADGSLTVVVSAIGQTTNLLEEIIDAHYAEKTSAKDLLEELKQNHLTLILDLFDEFPTKLLTEIQTLFSEMEARISQPFTQPFNFEYDQLIAYGELLSTRIVSAYLNFVGQKNQWIDIRTCLDADDKYRDANICWESSEEKVKFQFRAEENSLYLTQGFIASDFKGYTCTLGREGSDYTAAILAYLLNADEMIIWKDVLGVLNADPDYFSDTVKLDLIPYQEAIELSYYGASVIHPKTIKPLQAKAIPLRVKSFIKPSQKGTLITKGDFPQPLLPNFIVKKKQILITIEPHNFSFIGENDLFFVFSLINKYGIKLNFTQNTAVSFVFCVNHSNRFVNDLITDLKEKYDVYRTDGLELITVRHYTPATITEITEKHRILIEQKNKNTAIFLSQGSQTIPEVDCCCLQEKRQ